MVSRSFTACTFESLGVEVCQCGGNFLKALCCFLNGGLLSQNNRAGLNISMDLQMSSQATECECGPCLGTQVGWGPGKSLSTLVSWWDCGAGLTDLVAAVVTAIVCGSVLWFDPQVPVVQVGKEFSAQNRNVCKAPPELTGVQGQQQLKNPHVDRRQP